MINKLKKSLFILYDSGNLVDLGLPSGNLWATCNLGASETSECGLFYRWGELEGHADIIKPAGIHNKVPHKVLLKEYDAASKLTNNILCIPSVEDFIELRENTYKYETIINGVSGCRFINKKGESIFLPDIPRYWTNYSYPIDYSCSVYSTYIIGDQLYIGLCEYDKFCAIRPILKKK